MHYDPKQLRSLTFAQRKALAGAINRCPYCKTKYAAHVIERHKQACKGRSSTAISLEPNHDRRLSRRERTGINDLAR